MAMVDVAEVARQLIAKAGDMVMAEKFPTQGRVNDGLKGAADGTNGPDNVQDEVVVAVALAQDP